jgi:hypothetical protein
MIGAVYDAWEAGTMSPTRRRVVVGLAAGTALAAKPPLTQFSGLLDAPVILVNRKDAKGVSGVKSSTGMSYT